MSRSGSGGGPLIAANVIVTGRNPEYLSRAVLDLGAVRTAAFDATDPAALQRFFGDLPDPVDHVMVTAGSQYYARRSAPPWCRERSSRPVLAFELAPPHDRQIVSPVVRCATP